MPPVAANATHNGSLGIESTADPEGASLTDVYNDSLTYSYGLIAVSALLFRLLDWCLVRPLVNHFDNHLLDHRRWRIRNEVTSLVHATMSGIWALASFAYMPEMLDNMIDYKTSFAYALLLFSTGYLVQDAVDLMLHERSLRVFELQFHHVSIVFAIMCSVVSHRFIPIVAFGLLMEVNSMFLHSRSLCNLHAVDKLSISYRLLSVANLASFIVCRLSVNVYLLVWNFLNHEAMPMFYFFVLFFVMFSLLVVNLILFYRVLLADKFLQPELGISAGCLMSPWQLVTASGQAVPVPLEQPSAASSQPQQQQQQQQAQAEAGKHIDDDATTLEGLIHDGFDGAYNAVLGDGEQDVIP